MVGRSLTGQRGEEGSGGNVGMDNEGLDSVCSRFWNNPASMLNVRLLQPSCDRRTDSQADTRDLCVGCAPGDGAGKPNWWVAEVMHGADYRSEAWTGEADQWEGRFHRCIAKSINLSTLLLICFQSSVQGQGDSGPSHTNY